MNIAHIGKVPRIPVVDIEGMGSPPAIAGVDFDLAPWPNYTMLQAGQHYINEHVRPGGGDVSRTAQAIRDWIYAIDPTRDVTTYTRADGRAVVDYVLARGCKSATARRVMTMGAAALNHLKREERIVKVPKFQMPAASEPRVAWLTREQHRRIMQSPKPRRLHLFFLLAFGTGARAEAIEEAAWDRVNWAEQTLDYRIAGVNYKNKRRVVAPLNNALLERLRAAYERRTDDTVIGRGPSGRITSTYHYAFRLYKQLGINVSAPRHICRHTFASWLLQGDPERGIAPTDIHRVALLLGDTVAMVEKVYGHLRQSDLLRVVNGL